MSIIYKSFGSIVISGEYSFFKGHPILTVSLPLELSLNLEKADKKYKLEPIIGDVKEALIGFLNESSIDYTEDNFVYKIDTELPKNQGLGYTAALVDVAIKALYKFYTSKEIETDQYYEVLGRVDIAEDFDFFQSLSGAGAESGLRYSRREFDFLQFEQLLDFGLSPEIGEELYLIYTGEPAERASDLLDMVDEAEDEDHARATKIFRDIGKQTKYLTTAIKEGDFKKFEKHLVLNQKNLVKLGLVSEKADKVLTSLEGFGVGKITGFGGQKSGSGYVLFLHTHKSKDKFEKELTDRKLAWLKAVY